MSRRLISRIPLSKAGSITPAVMWKRKAETGRDGVVDIAITCVKIWCRGLCRVAGSTMRQRAKMSKSDKERLVLGLIVGI